MIYMYWNTVKMQAEAYKVDPILLAAIAQHESSWNPWAMRYEPAYTYYLHPTDYAKALGTSVDTEIQLQKFSYGLMQLMGGTLRQLGCPYALPKTLDPGINLGFGAQWFAKLQIQYPKVEDAISAYNAGHPTTANAEYVDAVMTNYKTLTAWSQNVTLNPKGN